MCIMCPIGCVYQLTPAELAHRVSRFGQTAKQHLLPVGVRRFSQLVLWKTEGETEKLETTAKDGEQWSAKELHEESSAMQLMKSLKLKFNFSARRIVYRGGKTHRCQQPPPPCQWRLESSGGR